MLSGLMIFVLLVLQTLDPLRAQSNIGQSWSIMFYNVENLFDTYDDSLTADNDFLPGGIMRWDISRYNKKINSIYRVVVTAAGWEPPAIVGLCEIENRKVLEDLIYGTYLEKYDYSIIHEDSPDRRGIDVCLIYRSKLVKVPFFRYLVPGGATNTHFDSRSILYAKAIIGSDTLHLFINHWPSRRGGVLAGEENRYDIASMIDQKADSINRSTLGEAKIIILGDFNCPPDDQVIRSMLSNSGQVNPLVNLSESLKPNGIGTYRFQGHWEIIDQMIVSRKLIDAPSGICIKPDHLRIVCPDFLLEKDPKYPGMMPFPTYHGYRYQGGFSDHLPILLDYEVR